MAWIIRARLSTVLWRRPSVRVLSDMNYCCFRFWNEDAIVFRADLELSTNYTATSPLDFQLTNNKRPYPPCWCQNPSVQRVTDPDSLIIRRQADEVAVLAQDQAALKDLARLAKKGTFEGLEAQGRDNVMEQ